MTEQRKEYKIEGRPATIYRVVKNKDNPYVMIDRRPVDNPKLSYKSKGILTYLLSRPDGWEVSVADLIKHGADGEASVRSGLKELKDAGHMKYTVSRNQGRITGWLIEVFEVSVSPDRDFQDVENPQVENRQVENRGQVLSIKSNNQLNSKRERDAIDPVFVSLSNLTGGLNSNTPKFVDTWRGKHPDEWILKAIEEAKDRKARSVKYIDEILLTWEANGYPKTREEKVNERKILPSQKMTQVVTEDVEVTDDELKAMKEKSDRLVREALERAEQKRRQKASPAYL